jgi:Spy/CpxP family protein refolding chaperone
MSGSPRLLAAALLAVAFLLGLLGGIFLDRWAPAPFERMSRRHAKPERHAAAGPWEHSPRATRRILDSLELAPEQRVLAESLLDRQHRRVREIMDGTRPHLQAVADETHEELESILSSEQMLELRRLAEREHESRLRRRDGRRRGGTPPPPDSLP